MALTYDLTGIANFKQICYESVDGESVHTARTESLIWASMFVGMDTIDDKNCREFYTRLAMHERVFGVICKAGPKDLPCTFAEVQAHVGLKTNANRKTSAQFDRGLIKVLRQEVK